MSLRLALFWYLYMCGWGIFFPYYSLYLSRDLGLPGTQVGLVMAMIPLAGLIAQPLWGQLADFTGSRRRVLTLLCAGTALTCALLVLTLRGFPSAILATAVFAIFATSVLPMSTSVTFAAVAVHGIGRFGPIRMCGTLGFLTMVVVFPRWLEHIEERGINGASWQGLDWMFPATGLFVMAAAAVAWGLGDTAALTVRSEKGDTRALLRHPPVVRLLLLAFTAHLFFQGSINFFPLFIRSRGGDVTMIGEMWIFMLLLEIPLIGFSGQTLRRLGARGLLTIGLLAEGIRWTTCAFSHDMKLVAAVQLLHGVGVAGVLIGAPLYLEQCVPERLRSTSQALAGTVSFGAGAILSNAAFGWLLEDFGSLVPYVGAGLGCLTLALLVRWVLPVPYPPSSAILSPCRATKTSKKAKEE